MRLSVSRDLVLESGAEKSLTSQRWANKVRVPLALPEPRSAALPEGMSSSGGPHGAPPSFGEAEGTMLVLHNLGTACEERQNLWKTFPLPVERARSLKTETYVRTSAELLSSER